MKTFRTVLALSLLLPGCVSEEAARRRCQTEVDSATEKVHAAEQKLDGDSAEALGKETKKANDLLSQATQACIASRSPTAKAQLAPLEVAVADLQFEVEKETAKRQKDPNADKRGAKPKLSQWDGANRAIEAWIKARLKNPDSYEHVKTFDPIADGAYWKVVTNYRATNSFGAKITESHTFWMQGETIVKEER